MGKREEVRVSYPLALKFYFRSQHIRYTVSLFSIRTCFILCQFKIGYPFNISILVPSKTSDNGFLLFFCLFWCPTVISCKYSITVITSESIFGIGTIPFARLLRNTAICRIERFNILCRYKKVRLIVNGMQSTKDQILCIVTDYFVILVILP